MGCGASAAKYDPAHVHEFSLVSNDDDETWVFIAKTGCTNCGAKGKPYEECAFYECVECSVWPKLCATCCDELKNQRARREQLKRRQELGGVYAPAPQVTHVEASRFKTATAVSLRVTVQPYGVLGSYMLAAGGFDQNAPEPDANVVFLDPAGLPYVQGSPSGAGGASGVIYKWLGISRDSSFPDDVRSAIQRPLQAKLHAYGDARQKKCLHVVGPNFSTDPCSRPQAVEQLATAYRAALLEFASSGVKTLRLLPISGGIFAGSFSPELPKLTAESLMRGFETLSSAQQAQATNGKTLEMCIFLEKEFADFQTAWRQAGCFDGATVSGEGGGGGGGADEDDPRLRDIRGDPGAALRPPMGRQPQTMQGATSKKVVPTSTFIPRARAPGRRTIPSGGEPKVRSAPVRTAPVRPPAKPAPARPVPKAPVRKVQAARTPAGAKPARASLQATTRTSVAARAPMQMAPAGLKAPKGNASFAVGQRVLCRDGQEEFRVGFVESVDPLKVKAFGFAKAFNWDEVQPVDEDRPIQQQAKGPYEDAAAVPLTPAPAAATAPLAEREVNEVAIPMPARPRRPRRGGMCKFRCGCKVAPGTTRAGKPLDTCCRACGKSKGKSGQHDDRCPGPPSDAGSDDEGEEEGYGD